MSNVSVIQSIAPILYRYIGIPVLVGGVLGNLFNVLIFTRRQLIKNPCSTYFLWSSVAHFSTLFLGLLWRIFTDGFGLVPLPQSLIVCRGRYFLLHSSMVLPSWLTILAGIDRYCISSQHAHQRRWSNLRYSRILVGVTAFIVFATYSHVLGLFNIEQLKSGPYCYAEAGAYRIFYDFLYFATFSFIPPIMMSLVGLATFYNVRKTHVRVATLDANNPLSGQLKKRDRQLIKMLLVQVIVTVTLTSPLAGQKLYSTFTQGFEKNTYSLAVESLVTQVVRILAFSNSAVSFYIFTLSGSLYRQECLRLLGKVIGCACGKNSGMYRRFQRAIDTGKTAPCGPTETMATVP